MRLMYDSTDPLAIPQNAPMVAGYIDGDSATRWDANDWVRFPNSVKVRIARRVSTNDGHVLDVEYGIPTVWPPTQTIVQWVRMRRASGVEPTIYCNQLNDWGPIRNLFHDANEPEPNWWVARYNNDPTIPRGAIAKQYANPDVHGQGHYDLSSVADYWPGVDGQEMSTADDMFTFTDPNGVTRTVSVKDMVGNMYAAEFYGSKTPPWAGASSRSLLLNSVDIPALAEAISQKLIAAGVGGATPDQVETALKNVLNNGVKNV